MSLFCQVEVRNLLATAHGQARSVNSWLTIGGCFTTRWLLHQTAQNKKGTRYKLSNVTNVFVKFTFEGKVTIRFRQPNVELLISGDPKGVRQLVDTIFCIMKGKMHPARNLTTVADPLVTPTRKLVIDSPLQHSKFGGSYPYSLHELQINKVCMKVVEPKIFRLQHLTVLNLEKNELESLPMSVDLLSTLTELHLADNRFGAYVGKDAWQWLRSEALRASLVHLDLSRNLISALPNSLPQLRALSTLLLEDNQLRELPNNLGHVKSLKTLSLVNNRLKWLPGSLLGARILNLDVTDNEFEGPASTADSGSVSLKALSASAALRCRTATYDETVVPRELVRYLESACFCLCGRGTFPSEPGTYKTVELSQLSKNVVYRSNSSVVLGYRRCQTKCIYNRVR